MSQSLADAVVDLLSSLEDVSAISRCSARGCGALSAGLPDYGPHVGDSVCADHVPRGAHLIGAEDEVSEALRAVYTQLEQYGYHYDRKTGRPIGGDDETDPVDIAEGI